MMLLYANQITSFAVVILCWWLAHQYSRDEPPGRLIATGFSLLGFSILVTAVGRSLNTINGADIVPWMIVISKAATIFTFIAISIRRHEVNVAKYGRR